MTGPPTGVVFFDVDGTLVPRTSSSVFLARFLGHDRLEVPSAQRGGLARLSPEAALAAAEAAYATGTMDNREVAELDAAAWAGVPERQIRAWLVELPLVPGIAETVAWCRRSGLVPVLATLAWAPVGAYLADRFGFAAFSGPVPESAAGIFTGRVASHFDEYDKRDFAVAQARDRGLALGSCGAVGDSRSDLPLFASVGVSVAFNASAEARAAATATVDGEDLREVIPALGRLRPAG